MTWKAIGDASACSMCCTDKAAGHRQKPSHTNFADHSVFNRWVSTGADFFFFFLFCAHMRFMDFPLQESGCSWRTAKPLPTRERAQWWIWGRRVQIACGRVTAQVKQQFSWMPIREVECGWKRPARPVQEAQRFRINVACELNSFDSEKPLYEY